MNLQRTTLQRFKFYYDKEKPVSFEAGFFVLIQRFSLYFYVVMAGSIYDFGVSNIIASLETVPIAFMYMSVNQILWMILFD